MGSHKMKWTQGEEKALHAGVAKHGPGKWKNILKDPEFSSALSQRSNIDLKDKWRNLGSGTSGQGTKDKSRSPAVKITPVAGTSPTVVAGTSPAISVGTPIAASPIPKAPNSGPAPPRSDGSSPMISTDLSKSVADTNISPSYNELVFEALSSMMDANGSEIGAIVNFIKERHEVPQNFRRLLGPRLKRLVQQGKLEKVDNRFKLCNDETQNVAKTPTETLKEAAEMAADKILEAEQKSYLAIDAIREYERVKDMYETAKLMEEFFEDVYQRCCRGEVLILENN